MKKPLVITILQPGVCLLAWSILTNGVTLCAQNAVVYSAGGPPAPGDTNVSVQVSGGVGGPGFALCINGSSIGTILLKACDQNQDGKVTLDELESVAATYFKLWDTNGDGCLSGDELEAGLKSLFPAPPPGAQAMAVVNGVAVQMSPDDMPTPATQIVKNVMALADTNKDGQLSLQEMNNWLDKSFSQWDLNGDGALDASELDAVFSQLAQPN